MGIFVLEQSEECVCVCVFSQWIYFFQDSSSSSNTAVRHQPVLRQLMFKTRKDGKHVRIYSYVRVYNRI